MIINNWWHRTNLNYHQRKSLTCLQLLKSWIISHETSSKHHLRIINLELQGLNWHLTQKCHLGLVRSWCVYTKFLPVLSLLSLYVLIVLIFRVCLSLVHPFGTLVLYILVQMPNTHTHTHTICGLLVVGEVEFTLLCHGSLNYRVHWRWWEFARIALWSWMYEIVIIKAAIDFNVKINKKGERENELWQIQFYNWFESCAFGFHARHPPPFSTRSHSISFLQFKCRLVAIVPSFYEYSV